MLCRIIDNKIDFKRPSWIITDEELIEKHSFYNFVDKEYNTEFDTLNYPEYIIEGNSVYYSFTRDLEKQKEHWRRLKLQELDAIYNSYILTLHPIEKQLKMTMQYNALLNKSLENGILVGSFTLTPEEQAEKTKLEDLHRWYKGLLGKHETDKDYIQNETDVNKLKNYIIEVE